MAELPAVPRPEADIGKVLSSPRTWVFVGLAVALAALVLTVKQPWVMPFVVGASAAVLLLFLGAFFDVYMCLY